MKLTIDYFKNNEENLPYGAMTEYNGRIFTASGDTPEHAKYLLIQQIKSLHRIDLPPRETVDLEDPDPKPDLFDAMDAMTDEFNKISKKWEAK